MDIRPEHLVGKPYKIGQLEGVPVMEAVTTGGLNIVLCMKSGKPEILGTGSHRAIGRHLAQKKYPKIVFTDLNKSDWVDPVYFQHLLPYYEALTAVFNRS